MLYDTIKKLLDGCYLVQVRGHAKKQRYKLYSGNMCPEFYVPGPVFRRLANDGVLKKKKDRYTVSRRAVQKLHGKNMVKVYYKQIQKSKAII